MLEVHDRVFVGSESSCRSGDEQWAVVHACKSPCHQRAIGYRGSLPKTHPNYLVLELANDLFLNIIDPPIPLFKDELFSSFLDFAADRLDRGQNLLIHCNQGESRAPSLALLYLSKSLRLINDESYAEARSEFQKIYPRYNPGRGIQTFLTDNWEIFGDV